ncbi:MAG: ATPase, T2SS/T4P/T4SS family, partial [Candidatus Saccharimonadales bacterium]
MGVKESFLGRLLGNADKFSEEQVAQTISLLIEHGVRHEASDIHIEPHENVVRVRYRVDNVLRGIHKLPLAALPAVIEQIKTLAHMHATETHLPQEGQFATLVGEDQFEIQVYTMPVIGGEKAVLHISRRLGVPPKLEELGFWG